MKCWGIIVFNAQKFELMSSLETRVKSEARHSFTVLNSMAIDENSEV